MNDDESVLYAKNPSAKLPPASTVKLVTAMVALDILDPVTKVVVSRNAASTRSIRPRLAAGDEVTVYDLLHLALMKSMNSAAVALAEAAVGTEDAFVELMNRKAQEIGANDTHFVTASGLPKGKQYTTARDLTIILKKALTYPLIKEIVGKKEWMVITSAGRPFYISNTDSLLWSTENMIGGKTGFTNSARHCFVGAIETEKGPIYTAVLGAPSRSRLWTSTLMLAELGANPELVSALTTTLEETPIKKHTHRARRAKKRAKNRLDT
jgi:D-alanyl-D-alanine carboxypeptidase (penicillin-binding protein 5/6)